MNHQIVILDGYTLNPGDLDWSSVQAFGDVQIYDRTPKDEKSIIERIGDAEIVLTNKTPISEAVLTACPKMKMISVLATGYDVIDVAAAKAHGVVVCNVPDYGTASVAQFTLALLLEACHHVGVHDASVHAGEWTNSIDFMYTKTPQVELQGKTFGIFGFGHIGYAVSRVALALGMRVIAWTPHPKDLTDVTFVDQKTLFSQSDVLSLHSRLTEENRGIINSSLLANMKPSAILINTARGGLINEQDLAQALNNGVIAAAAMDVVSTEPIQADNPLLKAKNCIITPHIAWASKEARQRIMDTTVKNISGYVHDKVINNVAK